MERYCIFKETFSVEVYDESGALALTCHYQQQPVAAKPWLVPIEEITLETESVFAGEWCIG